MKHRMAENFARSAKEPMIRQQVMVANTAWKAMKAYSGITMPLLKVAALVSGVIPDSRNLSNLPKNAPPSVKAML